MKILFISGREPGYARNSIILKGLKKNKIEVIECTDTSKSYYIRIIKVLLNFIFKKKKDCDCIFVGFFGQPIVPIVKLLTNKKIIFDAYMSGYDTMVMDKKKIKKGSLIANVLHFLDYYSCKLADAVLLDTQQHIDYFVKEFGINEEKFHRILIGSDEEVFYPQQKHENKGQFIVGFHGNFIPLQGIQYIIRAAKLLENEKDIRFILYGSGQTYTENIMLANSLKVRNIAFKGRKDIKEIPSLLAEADIGLGIFGESDKAKRVIPNKAYEILAMGKPLITADTPAARELLEHKNNVYFCSPADPKSLADAILALKNDTRLRERIADNGLRLLREKCTSVILGQNIKEIITSKIH